METYRPVAHGFHANRSTIYLGLSAMALVFLFWTFLRPTQVPHPTVRKVGILLLTAAIIVHELSIFQAVVVLSGADSSVIGTVTFDQKSKTGPVTVSGNIRNLDPQAQRGFHVQ